MSYTVQTWADNDPRYPVSAARMNHIESGIDAVANGGSLPSLAIAAPTGDADTDTGHLVDLITRINAAGPSSVGFPGGAYQVNAPLGTITVPGIKWFAQGRDFTIFKQAANLASPMIQIAGTSLNHSSAFFYLFEDFWFQNPAGAYTGDCFKVSAADRLSLVRVSFEHIVGTAFHGTELWDSVLDDVQFENCGDATNSKPTFWLDATDPTNANTGSNNVRLRSVQLEGSAYIAALLDDQTRKCWIGSETKFHGSLPTPSTHEHLLIKGHENFVIGAHFTNCGADQIKLQKGANDTAGSNIIVANVIEGAGNVSGVGYGINIVDSPANIIDANQFGVDQANASGDIFDGTAYTDATKRTRIGATNRFATDTGKSVLNLPLDTGADVSLPSGYLGQTISRRQISGAVSGPTLGTLRMNAIWLPAGLKISNLSFFSGGTAYVSAGTPHKWFALFDNNRNMLAVTADDVGNAWAQNTEHKLAIATIASGAATSFTTTYAGWHYIGLLISGAGSTVPSLFGFATGGGNFAPFSTAQVIVGDSSAETTIPAFPFQASALTPVSPIYYAAVS